MKTPEEEPEDPICFKCGRDVTVRFDCEFINGIDLCDGCIRTIYPEQQRRIGELEKELEATRNKKV